MWTKHLCLLFHAKVFFSNRKEEKKIIVGLHVKRQWQSWWSVLTALHLTGGVECPCHSYLSCILQQNINHSAEKLQNIFLATGNLQLRSICFHILFWWGKKTLTQEENKKKKNTLIIFTKTFRQKNSFSALQENTNSPHLVARQDQNRAFTHFHLLSVSLQQWIIAAYCKIRCCQSSRCIFGCCLPLTWVRINTLQMCVQSKMMRAGCKLRIFPVL